MRNHTCQHSTSFAFGLLVACERLESAESADIVFDEILVDATAVLKSLTELYLRLEEEVWERHNDVLLEGGLCPGSSLTSVFSNGESKVSAAVAAARQMLAAGREHQTVLVDRLARAWGSLSDAADCMQIAVALIAFCSALLETDRVLSDVDIDEQLVQWGSFFAEV